MFNILKRICIDIHVKTRRKAQELGVYNREQKTRALSYIIDENRVNNNKIAAIRTIVCETKGEWDNCTSKLQQ